MADLKKTLPPFVGRTRGIGEILSALQPELQRVEQEARAACRRLAIHTADETGMELWERELGAENGGGLSLDARRVLALLTLAQMEICTPRRLCALLEQLTRGSAAIQEDFAGQTLRLEIRGSQMLPSRLSLVERAMQKAAPAHLQCLLQARLQAETAPQGRRVLIQGAALEIHTTKEETI